MAELFPTLIRSTAVGLGATASKVGGLAAPFIAGLATFENYIPLLVFGTSSVIGGILAVMLPESVGAPLPQNLSEVIKCKLTFWVILQNMSPINYLMS